MKVYRNIPHVEYWYDRSTQCWWCMNVDDEGNQVGDAANAYTKQEIVDIAHGMCDDYIEPWIEKIPVVVDGKLFIQI